MIKIKNICNVKICFYFNPPLFTFIAVAVIMQGFSYIIGNLTFNNLHNFENLRTLPRCTCSNLKVSIKK